MCSSALRNGQASVWVMFVCRLVMLDHMVVERCLCPLDAVAPSATGA